MSEGEFEAHVYKVLTEAAKQQAEEEEAKIRIVKFLVEKLRETEATLEAIKMSVAILVKKQEMGRF